MTNSNIMLLMLSFIIIAVTPLSSAEVSKHIATPLPPERKVIPAPDGVANDEKLKAYPEWNAMPIAAELSVIDESDLRSAKKSAAFWLRRLMNTEWIPENIADVMFGTVGKPHPADKGKHDPYDGDEHDIVWARYRLGGYDFQMGQSSIYMSIGIVPTKASSRGFLGREEEEALVRKFLKHPDLHIALADWGSPDEFKRGCWREISGGSNRILTVAEAEQLRALDGKMNIAPGIVNDMWWGTLRWRTTSDGGLLIGCAKAFQVGPSPPIFAFPDWFRLEKFTAMGRRHLFNPEKEVKPK